MAIQALSHLSGNGPGVQSLQEASVVLSPTQISVARTYGDVARHSLSRSLSLSNAGRVGIGNIVNVAAGTGISAATGNNVAGSGASVNLARIQEFFSAAGVAR